MKNLWNKLPAWLKAILQGVVLLLPILIINQLMILTNIQSTTPIAWALPGVIISLFIYWKVIKRLDTNKGQNDIKLNLKMELNKASSWYQVVGLMFLTYSLIALVYMIAPIENTQQQQLIDLFRTAEPLLAIPLFVALSLHAGVVEEITFRGFIQNTLQRNYPRMISYMIIGLLFAISHLLPIELIVPYTLVSIAYSYVADQRKSIGLNIFSHFLIDFVIIFIVYFNWLEIGAFSWVNLGIAITLLAAGIALIFYKKTSRKPAESSSLSMG